MVKPPKARAAALSTMRRLIMTLSSPDGASVSEGRCAFMVPRSDFGVVELPMNPLPATQLTIDLRPVRRIC